MPRPKSERRRQRGSGTVFRDTARGVWVGRVPVGRGVTGRTRYREVSHESQRECLERMKGLQPLGKGTTVAEFAARWLAGLHVRPLTMDNYANSIRVRINPRLGHLRIADVQPHDVDQAAKHWLSIYAVGTVRLTLSHLSALFAAAVRSEVCRRNPVSLTRKPRPAEKRFDLFTVGELETIIREAGARYNARIIALLAATGMRKGEAVSLRVEDFDRAAGTIRIERTDNRHHGTGPPKSRRSRRTIRVPALALPAVVAAAGARRLGPLFQKLDGKAYTVGALDWVWARLLKRLGMRYRGIHQLRHACGTHMIAAGASIGDCAAYLGDREETIVATYTHPTEADPSATIDRMFTNGKKARRG